MTPDEAKRFADAMVDTWRNGPSARIWRDYAISEQLERDSAAAAFRWAKLERTTITVATFHAAYSDVARRRVSTLANVTTCEQCDSSGLLIVEYEIDDHDRARTHAVACSCPIGEQREAMLTRVRELNAASRRARAS